MSEGAAGVMVAPPPGLTTDEHIEGYVRQAVDAVGYACADSAEIERGIETRPGLTGDSQFDRSEGLAFIGADAQSQRRRIAAAGVPEGYAGSRDR